MCDDTILVVDDDETMQFLMTRALGKLGFEGDVVCVLDGVGACDWLRDNGKPLLMLLDLRMPVMTGHEVLEVLDDGQIGEPPMVYVASSSLRPEDLSVVDRYEFVEAYLEKPPSPDELRRVFFARPDLVGRFRAATPVGAD